MEFWKKLVGRATGSRAGNSTPVAIPPTRVKELRELILWLKSRGKTVFFSSHNISEVEAVCDRIGILSQGKLARVLEPGEWEGKGRLEEIFLETVSRSERVGPMIFGEEDK